MGDFVSFRARIFFSSSFSSLSPFQIVLHCIGQRGNRDSVVTHVFLLSLCLEPSKIVKKKKRENSIIKTFFLLFLREEGDDDDDDDDKFSSYGDNTHSSSLLPCVSLFLNDIFHLFSSSSSSSSSIPSQTRERVYFSPIDSRRVHHHQPQL